MMDCSFVTDVSKAISIFIVDPLVLYGCALACRAGHTWILLCLCLVQHLATSITQ